MSNLQEVKATLVAEGRALEEAQAWQLATGGDQALDRILGQRRLKLQADVIWRTWPGLQLAAVRFIEYVGPRFPGEDAPLAEEALVAAMQAYETKLFEPTADASAAAFLRALADAADRLLRQQVVGLTSKGRLAAWPVFEARVGDWIAHHDVQYVYLDSVPYLTSAEVQGGRDYLAHRVMSHVQYGLMKGGSLRPPEARR